MGIRVALSAVLVTLACTGAARAGEDFYLLMFGSQRVPANPNFSHSFATFVRVVWEGDGPCPQNPTIEANTISWLPTNMKVRVWALHPECGHNFELHETIRWCLCNDMRVSVWGAYRICPELYYRALRRKANLESGQIDYKANDFGYESDDVTNCIHAISTIVEGPRFRIGSPGWGETASYYILKEMEPWVLQPGCTHPWVGSALGLDQYPIIYRDYTAPRSGALRGPIRRLFGGERDLQPTYGPPVR
jgi:hypothetical protein